MTITTEDSIRKTSTPTTSIFEDRMMRVMGVALVMVAILGLVPTFLLVRQSNALAVNLGAKSVICEAIGPSCNGALLSADAKIGSIALSYLGFGWYVGLVVFLMFGLLGMRTRVGWPGAPWIFVSCAAGLGSMVMALQLVLKLLSSTEYEPCPLCLATHSVTIAFSLLVLATTLLAIWKSGSYRKSAAGRMGDAGMLESNPAADNFLLVSIIAAVVLGLAAMLGATHRETRLVNAMLRDELKTLHDDPAIQEVIFLKRTEEITPEVKEAIFNAPLPSLGDPESPATIVVAFDFMCSHCRELHPKIIRMLPDYEGVVKLDFLNFPISNKCNTQLKSAGNPLSCRAHLAALAAEKQGKYHEYAEMIFRNQRALNEDVWFEFADALDLDLDQFEADMKSDETALRLKRDVIIGNDLKLLGTPRLIVGGKVLPRGTKPERAFEEALKLLE